VIYKTLPRSVFLALFAQMALWVAGIAEAETAPINIGSVNASTQTSSTNQEHTKKVSKRYLLDHGDTTKVIGSHEITAAGPVGGAAGALAYAPGVSVSTYGSNGSSKASISINHYSPSLRSPGE